MLTKADIAAGLRELGLKQGDIVLLHSSLASLGNVKGGAGAVVEAFLDVLGDSGTLVAPVFEPGLGLISEAIGNHPRAVPSIHPLACVAAIGKDAGELCHDHWKAETAHTQETPYLRIADKGGYVCLLGVDQDRNTTLHTAEALLRLPYLTTESRTFPVPGGQATRSWAFFPGPHRDFIGLDAMLRKSGRMKMRRIGNSIVRLIRSRDLIDLALEAGRKDPAFVLCENPNCPDCIEQRARLRQDLFKRESFSVVASAALAGEFAETIAARCREAGISAVELDALRARPLTMLKPPVVVKAISLLREEGIQVVSLRSPAVSERLPELITLAHEQQVQRVVAPLCQNAAVYAASAKKASVAISFYNSDLDSDACSKVLLQLRDQKLAVGFTFNGANFARCGELPFLVSYKKKLRRFVDQLDVEDGTYDGRPQSLACGNAEVKEMISILRCASFSGFVTLAAGNRHAGSLEDAAARLQALLRTM
jgi:aminoglycoside 3-N-acetyltransferase